MGTIYDMDYDDNDCMVDEFGFPIEKKTHSTDEIFAFEDYGGSYDVPSFEESNEEFYEKANSTELYDVDYDIISGSEDLFRLADEIDYLNNDYIR